MQGNSPSVDLGAGRRDDHQAWADWARIGAIIAVASIHVLGPVSIGGPLSGTPFWWAVNTLKGFPHTARLYGSLDDKGRTAFLEGRLSASSLNASQRTQAASLQPLLPQAMQGFPADSVLLRLLNQRPPPFQAQRPPTISPIAPSRMRVATST